MLECMKGRQEFESSGLEEMFDDIGCEIGRNIDARMKGRNRKPGVFGQIILFCLFTSYSGALVEFEWYQIVSTSSERGRGC